MAWPPLLRSHTSSMAAITSSGIKLRQHGVLADDLPHTRTRRNGNVTH